MPYLAALKALPWTWIAVVATGAALVGCIVVQRAEIAEAHSATDKVRVELAAEKTGRAQDRTAWADASRQSSEVEREKETLRRQARDRNIEETRTQLARQTAAAADLRTESGRLRNDFDTLVAAATTCPGQGSGDPTVATRSPTATGAGLVLADLYRSADSEAEELALAFDGARTRGLSCERQYDSLTPAK